MDHIAVEKEFRGKGIGKVLMDTIEKDAREKNCQVSKILEDIYFVGLNSYQLLLIVLPYLITMLDSRGR